MGLTYLVLHILLGGTRCLAIYRNLLPPTRVVIWCLFSSRDAGSVDDVAGLQVVGTLRYGKSSKSAVGVGDINRRPSSLRLCDLQGYCYCK